MSLNRRARPHGDESLGGRAGDTPSHATVFCVHLLTPVDCCFRVPILEAWRALESQHIQQLCVLLINAPDEAAAHAIATELRYAIHALIESLRQELLDVPANLSPETATQF